MRKEHRPRHSPRAQVNEALTSLLSQCQPGDQLPPEPQLARRFRVSRATLREAMRSFEERGRIVRRHGIGTFVAGSPVVMDSGLEELESIDTLAWRSGMETHMGYAVIEEREATPHEAERLQISPGTTVLSVERVIMTGAQPVAFLVDLVPTTFLREQDLGTFRGSVLDLFLERGEPVLGHSRADIMAEAAQRVMAQRLHLKPGAALLKLEAQLYTRDGQVVDYSVSYFIPGHFHFHVVRRVAGQSETSQTLAPALSHDPKACDSSPQDPGCSDAGAGVSDQTAETAPVTA